SGLGVDGMEIRTRIDPHARPDRIEGEAKRRHSTIMVPGRPRRRCWNSHRRPTGEPAIAWKRRCWYRGQSATGKVPPHEPIEERIFARRTGAGNGAVAAG